MEPINLYLAIVLGLMARLAIPILITALVAIYLRQLDERWRAKNAELEMPIEKPECWKVKHCSPELRAKCTGYLSPLPCWQAFCQPNGYLREECLECKIFRRAYIPVLSHK